MLFLDDISYNLNYIKNVNVENIYLCLYKISSINNNCFLKVLLNKEVNEYNLFVYKDNINEETIKNHILSLLDVEINIEYKGYINNDNNYYIICEIGDFIETEKNKFAIVHEIINTNFINTYLINNNVTNLFIKKYNLFSLYNENNELIENIPIVLYKYLNVENGIRKIEREKSFNLPFYIFNSVYRNNDSRIVLFINSLLLTSDYTLDNIRKYDSIYNYKKNEWLIKSSDYFSIL
jgi:hypothetical protein